MHLPRPAQIRHELAEIGITYGLVIAVVIVGLLLYIVGGTARMDVAAPPVEPVGPVF